MENNNYQGVNTRALDMPNQVEFNRRKNVQQDNQIAVLREDVNSLLSQSPAGFLPRVFYGLTTGNQTYRFTANAEFTIDNIPGNIGDSYNLRSSLQTSDYILATAVQTESNKIQIVIQGDYLVNDEDFTLVNMRSGETLEITLESALSLQEASNLGEFPAANAKEKQITVLNDLELNATNVIFASLDLNNDGTYNWVKIGSYVNGTDGHSIYGITENTIGYVLLVARVGDLLLAGETFTYYTNFVFNVGDLNTIDTISPLTLSFRGNIRGAKGETGETGADGQDGADGLTPTIQDNYWYIGGISTGVKAVGTDGANGQDGQSFQMQSGLYSTPDNWGEQGNVGPNGETLLQLPTLPATGITGHGYVVYDPLTTPLAPYYDLYWANDGDEDWAIIHPFNGLKGQDGVNGETPYIQGGVWFIGGVSTGIPATGPQGPQGPDGESGVEHIVAAGTGAEGTEMVPLLTNLQVDTIHTALEDGKAVILDNEDLNEHYQVINGEETNDTGVISVRIIFKDKMILTYTLDENGGDNDWAIKTKKDIGGGGQLYRHNIIDNVHDFTCEIINSDSTPFTVATLKTFLASNKRTGAKSLYPVCHGIETVAHGSNFKYKVGLCVTYGSLKLHTQVFKLTISEDNSEDNIEYIENGTTATITDADFRDTVTPL